MKAKSKKQGMKNTDILTAGAKAYAKKRRKKQERVESVEFDFDARKEFLTGFSKRKQEKKKAKQERYQERLRQEKLKERAEIRAQKKQILEERLEQQRALLKGEQGSDDEEEGDWQGVSGGEEEEEEEGKKDPDVKEFRSEKALTTVTVIEDMDDWSKQ
ncbi:nucleolar protein 12-domain-containing protein [Syncephalastrum racemosum]|uniref:Nucleolar protein 12-domain-containing protein n=1 Tax=Syncephalastrum racemosum TaxID=13706 RepID=A0A1X2H5G0_SYNRA|nr:nucleolar protein 12-domain-containing protein [Syncephalastrum racemosum]